MTAVQSRIVLPRTLVVLALLGLAWPAAAAAQEGARLLGFQDFAYPALSPDGRTLAFFAGQGDDAEIYLLHRSTGAIEPLTDNERWDATPVWTPDGGTVIYQSEVDGNREIFAMPLDTRTPRNLTRHPGEDSHPKVTADGRFIIFDSNRASPDATGVDDPAANYEIYRMPVGGGEAERLTEYEGWDTYGALSPDGRYLTWRRVVRRDGHRDSEVFWRDLETGETRNLTSHPSFDGYPDWTPDGRILFASTRDGTDALAFDVYLMDPADGAAVRLTHASEDPGLVRVARPRATADGRWVVASRWDVGGSRPVLFRLPARDSVLPAALRMGFRPVHGAPIEIGGTSRGVAWGDYTGDGYPDLAVSNTDDEAVFLYRNVEGRHLERVRDTEVAGVAGYAQGVDWVDVDNDGWLDLFVARERGPNLLFRNHGGELRRAEAGALTGDELNAIQGCWADYDADGWLDAFVVHAEFEDDVLYRNTGDGSFERVDGPWQGLGTHARSCAWSDVDADGHPDLYVGVAYERVGDGLRTAPNVMFRNRDGRSFERVTVGEPVNLRTYTYGVSFADYDDDGDDDLLVSGIARTDPNALFENVDGTLFAMDRAAGIVTDRPGPAKGHVWGDFDNDGDLDLFLAEGHGGARPEHAPFDNRDRLYEQQADGAWVVAGLPTLTDHNRVSAGAAAADFDRDGDLDLFIANWGDKPAPEGGKQDNQFFINTSPPAGWIQLRFRGTASNRMGLGVRAAVTTGEGEGARTQYRTLTSTSGFGSMAEPVLHFGLGDAERVTRLEVRWPSGAVDVFTDVAGGARYVAEEGGPLTADAPRP